MNGKRPLRQPLPAPQNPYSQMLGRAIPNAPAPAQADQRAGNYNTTAYTFFTPAGQVVPFYTATLAWAKITLTLETAGPVEISEKANFTFLSGQAQALITNVPLSFTIAKGNTMYLGSSTVNRVKVTVEQFPWLEQIVGAIQQGLGGLTSAIGSSITSALSSLLKR